MGLPPENFSTVEKSSEIHLWEAFIWNCFRHWKRHMSTLNLPVDMVRETVDCRGGKSSPFRNEVIFPALSLSLTREQSLCGLSPTTIIMQEGERGDGVHGGDCCCWFIQRERQILWDSGEDFVQTRQGSLGKGSKSYLKHRKLSHVES